MEQPEVFKNFRRSWTNPVMIYEDKGDRLNRLREDAIQSIGFYKEEKNRIELRKKEEDEILKYFEYLDSLEKK